jgi:hypothetical protein
MQEYEGISPGIDTEGVISKSLEVGLEIEKSRLNIDFDPDVVRSFGKLLASKVRANDDGPRALSDPDYALPLRNLYISTADHEVNGSLSEILDFLAEIASAFSDFDGETSAEDKSKLVRLCTQLHQHLSDELRNREEPGFHGWWN